MKTVAIIWERSEDERQGVEEKGRVEGRGRGPVKGYEPVSIPSAPSRTAAPKDAIVFSGKAPEA